MPEPASLRTIETVRQWLEDGGGLGTTGLNLRDFSNDVLDVDKPAAFVILAGQEGVPLQRESDEGVREDLVVYVVGYVKAATEDDESPPNPVEPDVTTARERLIQTIRARLAFVDTTPDGGGLSGDEPDSLAARLRHDRAINGSGCEGFDEVGPTERDEGEAPPWGYFFLRCVARLHYQAGDF